MSVAAGDDTCPACDNTGLAHTPHSGLPLSMFACGCCTAGTRVREASNAARYGIPPIDDTKGST